MIYSLTVVWYMWFFVLHFSELTACMTNNYSDHCYGAVFLKSHTVTHTCQLSRFSRESPSFSSNLPLSQLEHQISRIKWTFEYFCALV